MDLFLPWDNCVNDAGVATLRCIPIVFQNIVTAALMFAGIVAVFFIIISGYKFMTSGGDPKAVEGARKTAIYAILGLVLILISFAIVQFISISTGVKCINSFSFGNCDTVEINPESIQEGTDIGDTDRGRSSGAPLGADDIQAPDTSDGGNGGPGSIRGNRDGGRTGSNRNDGRERNRDNNDRNNNKGR